ncbi:VOC family protein [Actinoplanes sp. NPDC049265]|uniref:VOC family protein n=1 Tax=Actinoplanes sp. NPDC049265 TaxID=3363902 RepID=UPI003713F07E
MVDYPQMLHTVLDTPNARELADFYRHLLGFHYRPGDEPPTDADADDNPDWLVLTDDAGNHKLAFQQVDELKRTTWPKHEIPMQLHVDYTVPTIEELQRQRARAESLGATILFDRSDDKTEPLYVFADLAGHPFCIFVA